jgi:hypothetical protein
VLFLRVSFFSKSCPQFGDFGCVSPSHFFAAALEGISRFLICISRHDDKLRRIEPARVLLALRMQYFDQFSAAFLSSSWRERDSRAMRSRYDSPNVPACGSAGEMFGFEAWLTHRNPI